ncbi:MAG TPA: Smr/MutS family protein [Thermoanaerobaculia bacterium]|nr:Smr/MutS family protein [Thermoanaerobaculia bacterium]
MSAASLAALEYPSLLAVVASQAASDIGRERILALAPLADTAALAQRRAAYDEAGRLLQGGALVPSFETALEPLLARAAGAPPGLSGRDVVALADLLETTAPAVARIAEADPPCEALAVRAATLPDTAPLRRQIRRVLDRRGEVREDASPELARLRGAIRRQREVLYQDLQGLVHEHRELLSEETVPMREGRLVLMLQSGARGRMPGLVHGRSATGKSFYFEPLGVVEGNNRLQQAWENAEAERQRLLAELAELLRQNLPALAAHADFLAGLDLLQAAHRFAEGAHAVLPELAAAPRLRLRAARHPLLDPDLAPLREEALGQTGHTGTMVPLDLELDASARALVITGPNAGGKTVALKTAGLLALMALAGLPVPAAAGSVLPELDALVATVGDEQDLLADRSTFSGRLLRLKEAWELAGPRSFVLLDELGSGTDPEEGAALASALLEGLVARGGLVLLTTHLGRVAGEALEMPGAACAAMEFDSRTGEPLYRLLPGPPGSSEAIALARRLGLARELLQSAERRLDPEGRQYRRLLAEVERLRQELAARLADAESEQRRAHDERARLERARADLEAERGTVAQRSKRELESFRVQVRQKLAAEVERLKGELGAGKQRGLAEAATMRLFAEAPTVEAAEEDDSGLPLVVGATVRHRALGWRGTLEKLAGGRAEVSAGGKRLRCRAEELVAIGAPDGDAKPARTSASRARSHARGAAIPETRPAPRMPEAPEVPPELMLIGERVEPALERIDAYLDEALHAGRDEVRVVHGHGSGRLRNAVREHLKSHRAVATWRPGEDNEGGNGATVVRLRG